MQRFTISLDDDLVLRFNDLIAAKGYDNRSEAVCDLIHISCTPIRTTRTA